MSSSFLKLLILLIQVVLVIKIYHGIRSSKVTRTIVGPFGHQQWKSSFNKLKQIEDHIFPGNCKVQGTNSFAVSWMEDGPWVWLSASLFYCCITNYYTIWVIQLFLFREAQFCRSEVWPQHDWVLCSASSEAKLKVFSAGLSSCLGSLGRMCFRLSGLQAESLLMVGSLRFPFPPWLSAGDCY